MKKATKKEILEIHQRFIDRYSDAVTELEYKNAYELVVAVALSAQCTDKRVNIITPALFSKYPTAKALSEADIDDVKALINSCSFFNNKAKNIIDMAEVKICFSIVMPSGMHFGSATAWAPGRRPSRPSMP